MTEPETPAVRVMRRWRERLQQELHIDLVMALDRALQSAGMETLAMTLLGLHYAAEHDSALAPAVQSLADEIDRELGGGK